MAIGEMNLFETNTGSMLNFPEYPTEAEIELVQDALGE
jgi:hypothetical protein